MCRPNSNSRMTAIVDLHCEPCRGLYASVVSTVIWHVAGAEASLMYDPHVIGSLAGRNGTVRRERTASNSVVARSVKSHC